MKSMSRDTMVRALKTVGQAFGGFLMGLVLAVWNVPGVPETVKSYVSGNLPEVLLLVGIPVALSAGALALGTNYLFRDLKK